MRLRGTKIENAIHLLQMGEHRLDEIGIICRCSIRTVFRAQERLLGYQKRSEIAELKQSVRDLLARVARLESLLTRRKGARSP